MKKILVLCTGNSCRSQMAHGYLRSLGADKVKVWSAGIQTHGLNPEALQTMKRDGIDISNHTSNLMTEYSEIRFDFVITVCDNANEHCPYFPGDVVRIHKNFDDPSKSKLQGIERDKEFDRVRQSIRDFSQNFLDRL